jgi:hypothetical protein
MPSWAARTATVVSRIVDDSLKRYARAREVLIDRLHEGLF